jgi:hypothetical protein
MWITAAALENTQTHGDNDKWVIKERGGILKNPRIKWQWKHNLSEHLERTKGSGKKKFMSAYNKKWQIRQINNLMMHLKL